MDKKMIDQLIENYKLPKEEHNKILEELKEKLFINKGKEKNPSTLFVVGSPGSGKTTYIKNTDFSKYININSDEYRTFNPYAEEIIKKYPTYYAKFTNFDAHLWGDELFSYALQQGCSVLREKAPIDESLLETIKTIPSNYEVEVHVTCTGVLESLLRTRERYEKEIVEKKQAKLSNMEAHQTCYHLLPDFLKKCLELGVKVNYIVEEGEKIKTVSVKENDFTFLQKKREESNKKACQTYNERIEKIKESKEKRNASKEEWEDLKRIEDIYLEIKNQTC